MLVLSRKKDECIVINNDITIVVVEIRGDKVRLGIEAPKEVPVHRREVFEAIARGTDATVTEEVQAEAVPAAEDALRGPAPDGQAVQATVPPVGERAIAESRSVHTDAVR